MKINNIAIILTLALVGIYGCKVTPVAGPADVSESNNVLNDVVGSLAPDFESDAFFKEVIASNSTISTSTDVGVTNGNQALRVDFDSVTEENKFKVWPNVKFFPSGDMWNWNSKGSFTVDITNPSESPANVIFKIVDNVGQMGASTNQLNYAVTIAAGDTQNIEMLFNGGKRGIEGYWDGEKINLRKLAELQVFVQGPVDKQSVILDNFQLVDATGDYISAEEKMVAVSEIPTLKMITDFSDGEKTFISERSVSINTTPVKTSDGQGVAIEFIADDAYPNITLKPSQPWDWSSLSNFNLAFDIDNPTEDAIQMFVRVDQAENKNWGGSADGVTDSMSSYVTLTPKEKNTYYMGLSQLEGHINSGMRSEPPKKSYSAQAISFGWGEKNVDLTNIVSVQLYLQNPTKNAKIILDSVRLIPNLDADITRYHDLVDQYGQYTGYVWKGKINSDKELEEAGDRALSSLGSSDVLPDRSKFGGWIDGPKHAASGFFRTEKIDGKWSLVDPEGYLFFMTGLDNIRMDDTVTVTGVDFDTPSSRWGKTVTSPLRNSMFTWLPDYDDPLAENYGYAGYVHSGAVEKGEVFSFYSTNLMRKYGTSKEEAMRIWRDVTLDRMQDWGFTTLGNWIDPMFFGTQKVAYEAHGWINGNHKRISTGNDYWGPIHDPFDPEFKKSAREMAERVSKQVDKNDPWLVGIFVDNEISWGNVMNQANHFGLVINALSYDAKHSPVKKAFTEYLRDKYQTIDSLNSAWNTRIVSWNDFEQSYEYRSGLKAGMKTDYSALLTMLSDKYFSTVRSEIKRVLPNHLYLGSRFADWGVTPEIARGAAKHVDVMSYNLYANDLNDSKKAHWKKLLPELDKPSVIGEFHFGSTDSGLFHGGIVSVANQSERAKMYQHYMQSVVDNPYFVGAHWFQYLDSPATGRAWDGENYNIGFVSITDEPYSELVESAKEFNRNLYRLRYGK